MAELQFTDAITGNKFTVPERDIIKIFNKIFADMKAVPCLGVSKRKGNSYAFLQFENQEQLTIFQDTIAGYHEQGKKKLKLNFANRELK